MYSNEPGLASPIYNPHPPPLSMFSSSVAPSQRRFNISTSSGSSSSSSIIHRGFLLATTTTPVITSSQFIFHKARTFRKPKGFARALVRKWTWSGEQVNSRDICPFFTFVVVVCRKFCWSLFCGSFSFETPFLFNCASPK